MFTVMESLGMGICDICETITEFKDFSVEEKEVVHRCEKCKKLACKKEFNEYDLKLKKSVTKMQRKGYYVLVKGSSLESGEKTFNVNPNISMGHIVPAVDYVRNIMKAEGFDERWFDFHYENHFGMRMEVVDYLWFGKYSSTEFDEDGHYRLIDEHSFWFYLKGDKRAKKQGRE